MKTKGNEQETEETKEKERDHINTWSELHSLFHSFLFLLHRCRKSKEYSSREDTVKRLTLLTLHLLSPVTSVADFCLNEVLPDLIAFSLLSFDIWSSL